MRSISAVLAAALLVAGCSRSATPERTEYRDERTGFTLRYPGGWKPVDLPPDSGEVRFAPADRADQTAEFISVFTVATGTAPSEFEIRRHVFNLLPVHGVSGFQQDTRTSADVLWFRFELTGSSGDTEWASVGVAAAGQVRMQIAVCAKPLPQWREGQKECDEVIRSFVPGDLTQ